MPKIIDNQMKRLSAKYLDSRLIMVMDLFLSFLVSALVLLLAYTFRHGSFAHVTSLNLVWMASSVVGSAVMFWLLKTYTIIIRHTGFKDLVKFTLASAGKAAIMLVALVLFSLYSPYTRPCGQVQCEVRLGKGPCRTSRERALRQACRRGLLAPRPAARYRI